jgi:hypothetical protein
MLHDVGLLAYMLPEADRAIREQGERLLGSLGRLDDYRNAGLATADQLGNSLLLGTLLVPLGLPLRRAAVSTPRRHGEEPEEPDDTLDVAAEMAELGAAETDDRGGVAMPLSMPFARRDVERLRLILAAQNRLRELHTSPRVKGLLMGKGYLEEALRWMEIHGGVQGQELAAHWRGLELAPDAAADPALAALAGTLADEAPHRPRRRRRRRARRRPGSPASTP